MCRCEPPVANTFAALLGLVRAAGFGEDANDVGAALHFLVQPLEGVATVTDPAHVETAARLRKQFQEPRAVGAAAAAGDDLVRDLGDYDRAFGLDDQLGEQDGVS